MNVTVEVAEKRREPNGGGPVHDFREGLIDIGGKKAEAIEIAVENAVKRMLAMVSNR